MSERMITIETRHGGKREMSVDSALAFLLKRRSDGFEIMVDGELWTRFNRERGVDPDMDFDEYKVSPHADLTDADHDYDKGMEFVDATLEDIASSLGVP